MRGGNKLKRDILSSFESLVVIVGGEPLASTEVIAKGMKQQHASTIKLVRKHADKLAKFGEIRFQIRFNTKGKSTEFAYLNERQAALLISFMRNSESVSDFKVALVEEFYRMRDVLFQCEHNLWQQMQALVAKEVESKTKASFGSHLMLVRKREIAYLKDELERLESEIQPELLN